MNKVDELCSVFQIYSKRVTGLTLSLELDEFEFRPTPAGVSFSALSLVIAAVPFSDVLNLKLLWKCCHASTDYK